MWEVNKEGSGDYVPQQGHIVSLYSSDNTGFFAEVEITSVQEKTISGRVIKLKYCYVDKSYRIFPSSEIQSGDLIEELYNKTTTFYLENVWLPQQKS